MGFSLGSVVNSVANISSRKSDKGKSKESSLYEFMNTMSSVGVQIKSNFEVEFSQIGGFQFFCQSINIPGLKSNNAELHYKGRSLQVPINCEQEHNFQLTVINDSSGTIYTKLREIMLIDYHNRMLSNGFTMKIKPRGDQQNSAGMNILLNGVRINDISNLDYSHSDSSVQTFTVDGYVNIIDFELGSIQKKEGLLGKVDKISGKISNILGK